ncbi:hypothetical protein P343_04525 [Sporolactobacillus laevolacticus DSM 442]|uniref:Uncharacterized protein n=1 Tax=Sporolactobacillus laevolacticus DSM 442 TaxID=1395513 RepID=V6IZQ0_9BACL|nr:hypothetical protein P343_04525 [Sporolactobacillus laevolacticus DSM 442]
MLNKRYLARVFQIKNFDKVRLYEPNRDFFDTKIM